MYQVDVPDDHDNDAVTSLRSHIAETIYRRYNGQTWTDLDLADALLADPTLKAIIDIAAYYRNEPFGRLVPPEVRALLAAWRASRAEQEPEQ